MEKIIHNFSDKWNEVGINSNEIWLVQIRSLVCVNFAPSLSNILSYFS